MSRALRLVAAILCCSVCFGEEPDLVEGARWAVTHWRSLFRQCADSHGRLAWYATRYGPGPQSILMVSELRIQFQTEPLSEEERLNGVEFKATTGLEAVPIRWWNASNRAWGDWEVSVGQGMNAQATAAIRKKGVWSDHRYIFQYKPLESCSQVPPMEDRP